MPLKASNWPDYKIILNVSGGANVPDTALIPPKIAPVTDMFLNVGYSTTILHTILSGSEPVTWFATGLPPGLNISTTSGTVTGTPTTAGEYPVTIEVRGPSGVGSDFATSTYHVGAAKTIFWKNYPGPLPATFIASQITTGSNTVSAAKRMGQYEFAENGGEYQIIAWPTAYSITGTVNLKLGNGSPLVTQPINNKPYNTSVVIGGDNYDVYVSAWTHAAGLKAIDNTQLVVE